MIYGSVCSGIEAATVAWHPLGWTPAFFSEIEAAPRAVLSHHYPDVPLHGDFTTIGADDYGPIDLLVGGTPCQSFSIAGLRKGLDDDRGNLALEFIKLAQRKRPRWLVWENVPGVLSSNKGRDFGTFLTALGEIGYGFAYRVLDAKYFGCACPRPRVFVVSYFGDWRPPAAVLFERESFAHRYPRSRRGPRPHTLSAQNAGSRNGRGNIIYEADGLRGMSITETERALGFPDGYTDISQKSPFASAKAGDEPCDPLRPHASTSGGDDGEANRQVRHLRQRDEAASDRPLPSDGSSQGHPLPPLQHQVADRGGHGVGDAGVGVSRRPSRLADGPRYKALGNSMAVPVMRWIGERIQMVHERKW
jgi:DNA (cytosine-5)-methyltransferase 1